MDVLKLCEQGLALTYRTGLGWPGICLNALMKTLRLRDTTIHGRFAEAVCC